MLFKILCLPEVLCLQPAVGVAAVGALVRIVSVVHGEGVVAVVLDVYIISYMKYMTSASAVNRKVKFFV